MFTIRAVKIFASARKLEFLKTIFRAQSLAAKG